MKITTDIFISVGFCNLYNTGVLISP